MSAPPSFAHFVSLRYPPCRGQHQRPGKAGSAVFREFETHACVCRELKSGN
jgi:uncharacterized protein